MISFIVPTLGRETLRRTLASIETRPGDEILLVCGETARPAVEQIIGGLRLPTRFVPCEPGGDWGHTERNVSTPHARGRYLAHIDDDDYYAPRTRWFMEDAIKKTPDRPVIFRMQYPNGITLWRDPKVYCGNVGTPMILIPNVPEKLAEFGSFHGGDCAYLENMKWQSSEIVWREEVIALLGHNT